MTTTGDNGRKPPKEARPLPRRFYERVDVVECGQRGLAQPVGWVEAERKRGRNPTTDPRKSWVSQEGSTQPTISGSTPAPHAFLIHLDGKPIRTPAKHPLTVPTRALAEAIAGEWRAQRNVIDPATMPLTKLANSAIDGVASHMAEVAADIAAYAGRDLLCYRAAQPAELTARQAVRWDPILAWARETLGAPLVLAEGVMPIEQSPAALAAIERALEGLSPFALAALHVMTTLTGSALLALAVANGRLDVNEAWAATHVDEDWQEGLWGVDAEARARKDARFSEMCAAARFLALL